MDERRLAELLKDAVADAPPPTFDEGDVTAESARQRVRHRNGVLAGSAFGVALLAGAAALGVALWTGPDATTDAAVAGSGTSTSNGNAAPYELPDEDNEAAAPTERGEPDSSPEAPKQGGSSVEDGGPAGPASTPSGCEQADRELAAALAGELPAAANLKVDDALPVSLSCPAEVDGASFDLPSGRITIMRAEPGVTLPTWTLRSGSVEARSTTSVGRTVVVISEPFDSGEPGPYADEVHLAAVALGKLY
jgi:hypothetical protein